MDYKHILYLALGALSFNFILWVIYHLTLRYFKGAHFVWGNAIVMTAFKPMFFLTWYLAVIYGIQWIVLSWQTNGWSNAINKITELGVFIIMVWFLFRLTNYVEKKMKANQFGHRKYDATTVEGIAKISRILLFTLAALAILQSAGVPLTAIYTVAGGAGLGITLAAQDLLKNFFGGFVLYFDRPFVVGDWVKSPDKEIEGNVQHIGWRTTCILTFDRQPLYVPNSTFLTVSVQNPSRMLHRRIMLDVGVRYEDMERVSAITKAVEAMLKAHPDVAQDQTIWVNLTQLASCSLNFRVYAYTKGTHWSVFQRTQEQILLNIMSIYRLGSTIINYI